MDHPRPRIGGGGLADSADPITRGGQQGTMDIVGRITSVAGVPFDWDWSTTLQTANGVALKYDAHGRRVAKGAELYLYSGSNRIATLSPPTTAAPRGVVQQSFLYAGVDHPLRLGLSKLTSGGGTSHIQP